jgi:hypothetical protein
LCLLHWRPESDTHNINAQNFFKESRNLIGTAILGINTTLQTDKWTCVNVLLIRIIEGVLKFLFEHVVSITSFSQVSLGVIKFVIT